MTPRANPSVRAKLAGIALRRLRDGAGWTVTGAAKTVNVSGSMISRIERGLYATTAETISALLNLYDADLSDRAMILDLTQRANELGWHEDDREGVLTLRQAWVELEAAASAISCYQPNAIPYLLQSSEYVEWCAMQAGSDGHACPFGVTVSAVQDRITTGLMPTVRAIVDESALTPPPDQRATRHQLLHLADWASLPNVTLHIRPSEEGNPIDGMAPLTVLDFEKRPSLAHTWSNNRSDVFDRREELKGYQALMHELVDACWSPQRSLDCLHEKLSGFGAK